MSNHWPALIYVLVAIYSVEQTLWPVENFHLRISKFLKNQIRIDLLTNDLISRDACLLQTARNEKNVHACTSRYIISVGILNSHKFRDSSWLLNWYVSLSLYKQALGRNQWILLCRSPNGATRRTPRLMELLTHDWTTTTTWREPFSIHTFIEHGILFNNAGISFPFHPTHSSWIWHNELFNSFCISTGCYWKIVVRITWNW